MGPIHVPVLLTGNGAGDPAVQLPVGAAGTAGHVGGTAGHRMHAGLILGPACMGHSTGPLSVLFCQTKEWRQAAEPAYMGHGVSRLPAA